MILCPVCVEAIAVEHVSWQTVQATCPRCRLALVLDGELVPLRPVAGYPDRLLALREVPVPAPSRFRVDASTDMTTVTMGGMLGLISKKLTVSAKGFGIRGKLGAGLVEQLADVAGVVPIQVASPAAAATTWRVKLLTISMTIRTLFEVPDWPNAAYAASVLNAALDQQRH